jgi:hypothetical protein
VSILDLGVVVGVFVHRKVHRYLRVYRDWLSHRDGHRRRYRMTHSNQLWHSHWLADFHSVNTSLKSAVMLFVLKPVVVFLVRKFLQVFSNGQ